MGFPGFLLSAARSVAATLDVKLTDATNPPAHERDSAPLASVMPSSLRPYGARPLAEATGDCAPSPEP